VSVGSSASKEDVYEGRGDAEANSHMIQSLQGLTRHVRSL